MTCKLISYPSLESGNDNSLLFINLYIWLTSINQFRFYFISDTMLGIGIYSVQFSLICTCWVSQYFSSVAQSCPTFCEPMDCSTLGLLVHHQLPEFTQIHVHWVSDAIQPSHPLSSSSPAALNLSQHQGFFKWVNFLHQVAKVLELQLQHQSFQWILRTDFL